MEDARPRPLRHALFAVLFVAGVVLRVLVCIGYRPALYFTDSFLYLGHAEDFGLLEARPAGYQMFLWPIVHLTSDRAPIVVVQHMLGLLLAVACYALLVRRAVPTWLAALAVVPVLGDPLQLVMEHYVSSDLLFEVSLVGACLVLLWRSRPGVGEVAAAGLLVAGAMVTRSAATLVAPVFLVALVCLRADWRRLVAFAVACVVPLAGYALAFHAAFGTYALSDYGPRFLYARLAPLATCKKFVVPQAERPLCPTVPVERRNVINYYIWGKGSKRQFDLVPPPGMTQLQVIRGFDKRVVRNQTKDFLEAFRDDFFLGFSPDRTDDVYGNPAERWLFEGHYWVLDSLIQRGFLPPSARANTSSNRPVARFLTGYRKTFWTPGPLLCVLGAIGIVALLGPTRRSRLAGDRVTIGLLLGTLLIPLATSAAVSGFSWRYQLPQLPMLPVIGALALTALVRGRARSRGLPDEPYGALARAAALVTARLPDRAGRALAVRALVPPLVVAATAGCLVAVLCGYVLARSQWIDPTQGRLAGLLLGVLVCLGLLVSWVRGRRDAAWIRARRDDVADSVQEQSPMGDS